MLSQFDTHHAQQPDSLLWVSGLFKARSVSKSSNEQSVARHSQINSGRTRVYETHMIDEKEIIYLNPNCKI